MKITTSINSNPVVFPCFATLKEGGDKNVVVLFFNQFSGIVVSDTTKDYRVGQFRHDWSFSAFNVLPAGYSATFTQE